MQQQGQDNNPSQSTSLLAHQDSLQVPQGLNAQAWFPDSGASHHINPYVTNLQNIHTCAYPNEVLVENGHSLTIKSIGSSTFKSKCSHRCQLAINNLLHIPNITRNLISVSKFAKDSIVYFEFCTNKCFIKSNTSKLIFLEGFGSMSVKYLRPTNLHRPKVQ